MTYAQLNPTARLALANERQRLDATYDLPAEFIAGLQGAPSIP